jgi:hypothetical protein
MVASIEGIRQKFAEDQFEFLCISVINLCAQDLVREVREAIVYGQVIEDYPNDKYGQAV